LRYSPRSRAPTRGSFSPVPCGVWHHEGQESSQDLREAWAELLAAYPWDWTGTFTFRTPRACDLSVYSKRHRPPRATGLVHPETADKTFRLYVSKINRALYGPRWYKKGLGVNWARGLEFQRRGTTHYHALFSGTGELRRLTYMDLWNELAGFARIESPRDRQDVVRYISKYVVKGGEIDLGGPWFSDHHLPLPFTAKNFGQVVTTPEPDGAHGSKRVQGAPVVRRASQVINSNYTKFICYK